MTRTKSRVPVVSAPDLLAPFSAAGVLAPIDVHAAVTVGRLLGESDDLVLLAAALAVRATRFGHVRLELSTAPETVVVDGTDITEVEGLPWPDPETWIARLEASALTGEAGPLVLDGTALYLSRYRAYEEAVLAELQHRLLAPPTAPDPGLRAVLDGLVPLGDDTESDRQRLATVLGQVRPVTVIAGGPGTGKTWTIARLIAVAVDLAERAGLSTPEIAIAAPTGKAAKRVTQQLHTAREQMLKGPVSQRVTDTLADLEGMTLHRLLGWHPERGRFRHHADAPLPHDLVIVDETSMVSLALMAKLLDAVRPDARLILVGDPGQLASIEAGTVLGDIVGPADDGLLRFTDAALEAIGDLGGPIPTSELAPDRSGGPGDSIVVLSKQRRFGDATPIAKLGAAVRSGDPAATMEALAGEGITWHAAPDADPAGLEGLHPLVVDHLTALRNAGIGGDATGGLKATGRFSILCAHRRGPRGVAAWGYWSEAWVRGAAGVHSLGMWYPGRPVMVTQNDYVMNLFNGDIGVTVATDDGLRVAFEGPEGPRLVSPTRLNAIESVYAMTIHKSQGSEFDHVVVVLPDADSPLATRELVYTAFTRAKENLTVVGSEEALVAALGRRVARASGLGPGLWGEEW